MNNTNKRKHRCKEKLPSLNGVNDKRRITKTPKNLNFQTKHATRQQACKAKMHRLGKLPTETQLQTKVGTERKLPPLNGVIDKRQITKKTTKK